jgi:hypothetical protein
MPAPPSNFGDQVFFVWKHEMFTASVSLSPATIIGVLRSAPGHAVFSSFVGLLSATHFLLHFCFHIVTDDKSDAFDSEDNTQLSLVPPACLKVMMKMRMCSTLTALVEAQTRQGPRWLQRP